MVLVQLTGRITDKGQLEIELPQGLPPGEVQVTLQVPEVDLPWEERPWTDAEIDALTTVEPKSGAEIVAWLKAEGKTGWEDIGMSGAEWVEEQRRKHQERSQW